MAENHGCDNDLHTAARDGDLQALKDHIADQKGDAEKIKALVNHFGAQGRTPLQRALAGNQIDIAEHLLSIGALCTIDILGRTCLHWAIDGGADACALLLTYPNEASNSDRGSWKPTLVEENNMLNAISQSKSTPLHFAVSKDQEDAAKLLLEQPTIDVSLKHKDEDQKTPLELYKSACGGWNAKTVKLLKTK